MLGKLLKSLYIMPICLLFWGIAMMMPSRSYADFDHTNGLWGKVLKNHVVVAPDGNQVQYGKLKENASDLDSYLKNLESVGLEDFTKFSRDEQLSFLINAYNAFTVKLILNHYPVKSIKDIGGLFSSPWKSSFFTLLGKKRSLDDIEHGMIRQDEKGVKSLETKLISALKKFDEPRIHFAVNCASKGCPLLNDKPYVPEKLDMQLEEATKNFLKDRTKNRFDAEKMELHLSNIFKWYGADFEKASGQVVVFVAPKMASSQKEEDLIKKAKVNFLDYDWSLNGK